MTSKRTPRARNVPATSKSGSSPHPDGQREKSDEPERIRGFKIVQYLRHPVTGETLMTPAQLQAGLDHRSFKKTAWAKHDKDVTREGIPVPPHVHIALKCDYGCTREQVAKWFDTPLDLVEPLSGHGAFISYVRYLTHEDPTQQALGKYRYPDSQIIANFDWRSEVDAHFANGLSIPARLDELKLAVMRGELELWELRQSHPQMYADHLALWKRLSADYREVSIAAGTTMPHIQDMKLRVRTGVTLRDALLWIADQLGLEGDDDDRMWWASNAVTGKEHEVDYR